MHYASVTNENPSVLITKYFGISFTMYQLSQISGNLFSSLILKTESATVQSKDQSYVCGSSYCAAAHSVTTNQQTEHSAVVTLLIIFLTLGAVAVVSTLLFLDNIEIDNKETSVKNVLSKTFQSLLDWRILFLMPISVFIGLESGFVFADLNEPITVSCFIPTRRLHSLC